MRKICIFLGSATGNNVIYIKAAKELGEWIAKNNYTLVYGGSKIGLMGVLADSVLKNNGKVEAFACKDFEKVLHPNLTKTIMFNNMADRKKAEIEYADAFIAFPGGLGTLDELFEVWTLAKANVLQKPIGILNINGIFTPLYQAISGLVKEGFITNSQFEIVSIADTVETLMYKLFPIATTSSLFSSIDTQQTTTQQLANVM